MFPPEYIIDTNKARKETETHRIALAKAKVATPPEPVKIKELSIKIGENAKKYSTFAAAAEKAAKDAYDAAKTAASGTPPNPDLIKLAEYAKEHYNRAGTENLGVDKFIKLTDVAQGIIDFDIDAATKAATAAAATSAAAATAAGKAAAAVAAAAGPASKGDANSAFILAENALTKTTPLKKAYDENIIKSGAAPAAFTAASAFRNSAEETLRYGTNALNAYNKQYKYTSNLSLKTKIEKLIKDATDLVNEATNGETLATIKRSDDSWVIQIATTTTSESDKKAMLNTLAKLIKAEKINIDKGTGPTYKISGYGDTQFDKDTAPKVELSGDELLYYTHMGTQHWIIPSFSESVKRSEWRQKRIDRWTLNDLKLKYIFNNSKLLNIGKTLADTATTPELAHLAMYASQKELQSERDHYLRKIQIIEAEKKDSTDPAAAPLVLHGGGKQYNKKTLKNKQFKRKQTHRKQKHRKQTHKK